MEALMSLVFPRDTWRRWTRRNPAIYAESDITPFRLRPNSQDQLQGPEGRVTTVRVNSQGYRGPELRPPESTTTRILILGGHSSFGWGVANAETYASRLESKLHAIRPGDSFDVINASLANGEYPDTYYLYLRTRGIRLDPDVVIVGLSVATDIDSRDVRSRDIDSRGAFMHIWTRGDEKGLPLKIDHRDLAIKDGRLLSGLPRIRYGTPLLRDSSLLQSAVSGIVLLRDLGRDLVSQAASQEEIPHLYRRSYSARTSYLFGIVESLLAAISEVTTASGSRLLVLLIPAPEQVYPEDYALPRDEALTKPQRLLGAYLAQHEIPYLDLLPYFRGARGERRLYYRSEPYLTVPGHRLVAEAIVHRLLESGPTSADHAVRSSS